MYPPWDEYRAFMVKHPSVRPLVIGDVVHLLLLKAVLELAGEESNHYFGEEKLYGVFGVGI